MTRKTAAKKRVKFARGSRGDGIGDWIREGARRVNKFFSKDLPDHYSADSERTLREYGHDPIVSIQLKRAPIVGFLNKALDLLTLGRWSEAKRGLKNYDRVFHLAMIASVQHGAHIKPVTVEKNQRLNISPSVRFESRAETVTVSVPPGLTIATMLARAQQLLGKDKFFNYDAFSQNCQDFIVALLQANGMAIPELISWVKQDTAELLKRLPSYSSGVAKALTDIAAKGHELIHGQGIRTRSVYVRRRPDAKTSSLVVRGHVVGSGMPHAAANYHAANLVMHGY